MLTGCLTTRLNQAVKLHIAARLRVVSKHTHVRKISVDAVRQAIQRAAKATTEHERPMVAELEQVTGLSIAELAKLTEKWLPRV
jgi:hypothetical protein